MALINRDTTLNRVCNSMKKIQPPAGIEILSYKRDRSIAILRLSEEDYSVRQRGFNEAEYSVSEAELPKLLKSLIKKEFPRSRKLRLNSLTGKEGPDSKHK